MFKEMINSLLDEIEQDNKYDDLLDDIIDNNIGNQKLPSTLNPGVSSQLFNFYSEIFFSYCLDGYKEKIQKVFLKNPKKIFIRLEKLFNERYNNLDSNDFKILREFFPVIKEPINLEIKDLVAPNTEGLFTIKYDNKERRNILSEKFDYNINAIFNREDLKVVYGHYTRFKSRFGNIDRLVNVHSITFNLSFEDLVNVALEDEANYAYLYSIVNNRYDDINTKIIVLPFNEPLGDFIIRLFTESSRRRRRRAEKYKATFKQKAKEFLYENTLIKQNDIENSLNMDNKLVTCDNENKGKTEDSLSTSSDENLSEDIEKHDTLNPELFEQNELKKDVKETIENIADLFIEELSEQDIKFKLKDIILLGSNVSYNYTKDSDLDVHLIADSKDLKCPDDLYPLLYGAYVSLFNKNYDITIKGIPVELYVEIDESTAKSNGIYSLTKGWIKEPVQTDIPDIDFDEFNVEFKNWEDRYLDIINNKLPENKNKSEVIKDFISDLYDLRKQSITKDGEYGLGNLIFKEFRNKGYLDYLKDQRKVEKSKELSLESLQEDIDTDNLDKLNKTIKQLSDAGVDWEIESNLDDEYSENIIILNDMEDIARAIIKSIYGNCYIRLFDLDRKLPYFKVMDN